MEKGKQLLASTSEQLPESATLDAVSLLEWSRAGMSSMQVSKNLERFLRFPPLHYSRDIFHFYRRLGYATDELIFMEKWITTAQSAKKGV
ncbi:hypothetical protein [Brevibacillus sp. NRS-1366]|uniref:hypothetical protein n=1 Tax=Brevibacillus sp. NRS-1366 TaxID=3233899 RepID=UPI003D1AA6F3